MAGNLIYITDAGRAALVAPDNTGTTAREVTQIGLATTAFVFKPDMIALPNELKRITTFGGNTVAKDTIHIAIQDDSADQYKLYGFGLYLDNGVLFGIYVQNDPILEKAPASMMLLAADTVFASIDVTKLVFGPTSFLNPPATTERKGVVELATQTEVDAGADDVRAMTPKTAAARYAPLVRPQLTGPVSITSTATDQDAQFAVDGGPSWATIYFKNSTKTRFTIGKTDTDDFAMTAWADDGTTQSRVFDIARGTQVVSLAKRPIWAGGLVPFDTGNFDPNNKVNKSGDTMTGDLAVKRSDDTNAKGVLLKRPDGTNQFWIHGARDYLALATMNAKGEWRQNVLTVRESDLSVSTSNNLIVGGGTTSAGDVAWGNQGAHTAFDGNIWGVRWSTGNGATWLSEWVEKLVNGRADWGTTDTLSRRLDGKANAGAQCQKGERSYYFGIINQQIHLPDPWCIDGLEDPLNAKFGEIRIYGCWYRNQ